MRIVPLFFSLVAMVCLSCTKDIGKRPIQEPPNSNTLPLYIPPNFNCLPLDSILTQSGNVKDTVADPFKSVTYWKYNPCNTNEVTYVVGQTILYFNTKTRERKIVGDRLLYWPDINNKGWMLFTTVDFECFVVKVNGDSLRQVTFDGGTNARWDYSDSVFYYYKMHNNTLYKKSAKDFVLDSIYSPKGELLHASFSKKSNRVAFQNFVNNKGGIYLRDLSNPLDIFLFEGGNFVTFDYFDNFLYWITEPTYQSPGAVLRCEINTKKIDTLFKNCYNNRFISLSLSPGNKLCLCWLRTTLMFKKTRMFSEYRTFEVNLNEPVLKLKEVSLFP